jgi:hypothetical protein
MSERICAAVRDSAAVLAVGASGSAAFRAVREAVCGIAQGNLRSVAVRAAVCGCPVVHAAMCGCPAVRQCAAVAPYYIIYRVGS